MNIVIINCFDAWEHRVDLLYKVFIEKGHKVQCFSSDFRHFNKGYRTDKKQDFHFFHAKAYKKNISIGRVLSHINLSKKIFGYVGMHADSIDLLWVLAPPNVFIKEAAKVKRNHKNIKLIIDLMDLWPESMPVNKTKPLLFGWKNLRDKYINLADVIVTECNLYRNVLRNILKEKRVEVLYLAREYKGYEPHLNLPEDKISLCYLGSINNIIDIEGIIKVIKNCQKKKPTVLHIIGDGEKKNELISRVKEIDAEIVDHGTVYGLAEKQKIFDSCHYGLNMMKETVYVGLTMKSIDYFEFGLPIINNIHGDTWDIIEKYSCGINVQNDFQFSEKKIERQNSRVFFENNLTETVFKKEVMNILADGGMEYDS